MTEVIQPKMTSVVSRPFSKKLEYYCLVESTKIENAIVPYKTVQSESNTKADRMWSNRWNYQN